MNLRPVCIAAVRRFAVLHKGVDKKGIDKIFRLMYNDFIKTDEKVFKR